MARQNRPTSGGGGSGGSDRASTQDTDSSQDSPISLPDDVIHDDDSDSSSGGSSGGGSLPVNTPADDSSTPGDVPEPDDGGDSSSGGSSGGYSGGPSGSSQQDQPTSGYSGGSSSSGDNDLPVNTPADDPSTPGDVPEPDGGSGSTGGSTGGGGGVPVNTPADDPSTPGDVPEATEETTGTRTAGTDTNQSSPTVNRDETGGMYRSDEEREVAQRIAENTELDIQDIARVRQRRVSEMEGVSPSDVDWADSPDDPGYFAELTDQAREDRAREQFDINEVNARRMLEGDAPMSPTIDESDFSFEATDDGVNVSLNEDVRGQMARQQAASNSDLDPDQFNVNEDGTVAPDEDALRSEVASQSDQISPEDVEIIREDGRIVGAEAEVTTGGQGREEQFLPSIDFDLSERSISYESGDWSAAPDPTPMRIFGEIVGLDEETIQDREERIDEQMADTQGAPPVGLGSGRGLPVRGAAAAAGAIGTAAAVDSTQETTGDNSAETERFEAQVGGTGSETRVGIDQGVTSTEVGLGNTVGVGEISVGEPQQTTGEVSIGEVQPSSEVDVGEPRESVSEISIGEGTAGESTNDGTGESVVPGEYPRAGENYPRDPSQEAGQQPDVTDIVADTSPVQINRSQEQTPAQEPTITIGEQQTDILREINEEGTVTRDPRGAFLPERTFPTGESAVIGRALERTEQVGQSDLVQQDSDLWSDVGVGQTPAQWTFSGARRQTDVGTDTWTGQWQDTQQDVGFSEATAEAQLTGQQTLTETFNESVFGTEAGVGTSQPAPGEGVPPFESGGSDDDDWSWIDSDDAIFGTGIADAEDVFANDRS